MKTIIDEINENRALLESYDDKKAELIKERTKEMEELERKYYRPLYETEKALDQCSEKLSEYYKKLSRLSKFHLPTMTAAIRMLLKEIEGEDFVYQYVDSVWRFEGMAPLRDDIETAFITTRSIRNDLLYDDKNGKVYVIYPLKYENDILFFQENTKGTITKDSITFYDENGNRTFDTKKYDYIYDFIDYVIGLWDIREKDALPKWDLFTDVNSFVRQYKKKEKNKVMEKTKNGNE